MRLSPYSCSDVAVASDAASLLRRSSVARRLRCPWLETKEIMRLISQSELLRATNLEFHALLRRIAADLPPLREGSHELRIGNLHNIRVALARARIPAAMTGSICRAQLLAGTSHRTVR